MKRLSKKGTSLVELIAVIVILGVIAGIAVPATIGVINRQKTNAAVLSVNNIYQQTKSMLVAVDTGAWSDIIVKVDDHFCYLSLTTMITSGNVDGAKYVPEEGDLYFCYDNLANHFSITTGNEGPSVIPGLTTDSASITIAEISMHYDSATNLMVAG